MVVFILQNFLKVAGVVLLVCLTGCTEPNYFEQVTTSTEEVTTEGTSENMSTEHHSIFPDSVYEYDVTDTILVPD